VPGGDCLQARARGQGFGGGGSGIGLRPRRIAGDIGAYDHSQAVLRRPAHAFIFILAQRMS
jgi:hypothetical protein